MKRRILGAIAVILGGSILISGLMNGTAGEGTYAAGQIAGLLFGLALFGTGFYYLLRGWHRRKYTYLK